MNNIHAVITRTQYHTTHTHCIYTSLPVSYLGRFLSLCTCLTRSLLLNMGLLLRKYLWDLIHAMFDTRPFPFFLVLPLLDISPKLKMWYPTSKTCLFWMGYPETPRNPPGCATTKHNSRHSHARYISYHAVPYLHPSQSGYPSLEWTQPSQHSTEHHWQPALSLCSHGPGKSPLPLIVADWTSPHLLPEWPSWGPPVQHSIMGKWGTCLYCKLLNCKDIVRLKTTI